MSPTTIPGNLILQSQSSNDPLLDLNTQPSLDLQFATSKTLDDRVSGLPLVDHQRDVTSGKSAGTYVDSTGVIRTSKVNLLTYSEEFDNNAWIKTNVDPDTTVAAPNGALSAQKIKENSTTNSLHSVNISTATLMNGVYTFSVYAKASERSIIALNFTFANGTFSTSDSRAWFNLSNGTVGTTLNASDATIDPVGSSGWYRCTLVSGSFSSANRKVLVATSIADGSVTHNGDGTSGIYLWGAQLEEGSTASPYIKTTNLPSAAPRFDHDPTTNASLGLLVEESRTNYVPNSINMPFNLLNSGTGTTPTVSSVSDQAPDGSTNSVQRIQFDRGTGNTSSDYSLVGHPNITGLASALYSQSLWLKSNNGNTYTIIIYDVFGQKGDELIVTPSWERHALDSSTSFKNSSPAATTIGTVVLGLRNDPTSTSFSSGNNNSQTADILVWGLQLEAGSFATSYIPTSGSTVTRAADEASITGSNFSRWYNQSEGSFYVKEDSTNNSLDKYYIFVSDGANSDRLWLSKDSANRHIFRVYDSGNTLQVVSASPFLPASPGLVSSQFVGAYFSGDSNSALNGSIVGASTNNTFVRSGSNSAYLGSTPAGSYLNGHVARLTYYPYRLPDSTLQTITS